MQLGIPRMQQGGGAELGDGIRGAAEPQQRVGEIVARGEQGGVVRGGAGEMEQGRLGISRLG